MVSVSNHERSAASAVFVVVMCLGSAACGKKGPPLPPLVKVPAAPADLTADRRGETVDLQFTVPAANTDGTRPANIERVDVYGITGPPTIPDDQLLKRATKVASVPVKSPRDPNQTVEEDEPAEDVEPAVGAGLDQGASAHVSEELTEQSLTPVTPAKESTDAKKAADDDDAPRPLVGAPPALPSRLYVGVGVSTHGRKGPLSTRVAVPLVSPPPPPAPPTVSYDETRVTIMWPPIASTMLVQAPATDGRLPAKLIGLTQPSIGYNVYDVSTSDGGSSSRSDVASGSVPSDVVSGLSRTPRGVKLTKTPLVEPHFSDPRIAWGEKRCYTVRAVETIAAATIESDAAPAVCETLTDTFPPAAPKNLKTVASEGAINLIWDANTEKDLAGYLVFRGTDETFDPITPAPIQDTTFKDTAVQAGVRYVYAVKALDKAGNVSPASNRADETAR